MFYVVSATLLVPKALLRHDSGIENGFVASERLAYEVKVNAMS